MVIEVGSLAEEENESGFAHFVEHMLFRETEHYWDGEIEGFMSSIGATSGPDMNAFTTHELTKYTFTVPLGYGSKLESLGRLLKAIHILKDMVSSAQFRGEDFEAVS